MSRNTRCALCNSRLAPEGMKFCDECWNVADSRELQEAFDAHQDAETQWAQQLAQCEREHDPQTILRKDWSKGQLIRAAWLIDRS